MKPTPLKNKFECRCGAAIIGKAGLENCGYPCFSKENIRSAVEWLRDKVHLNLEGEDLVIMLQNIREAFPDILEVKD